MSCQSKMTTDGHEITRKSSVRELHFCNSPPTLGEGLWEARGFFSTAVGGVRYIVDEAPIPADGKVRPPYYGSAEVWQLSRLPPTPPACGARTRPLTHFHIESWPNRVGMGQRGTGSNTDIFIIAIVIFIGQVSGFIEGQGTCRNGQKVIGNRHGIKVKSYTMAGRASLSVELKIILKLISCAPASSAGPRSACSRRSA